MITKKKRDAKFIIYQSLYILVIVLLGIKGYTIADIPEKSKIPPPPIDPSYIRSLQDSLKILEDLRAKYNFVVKWSPNDTNATFAKDKYVIRPLTQECDCSELASLRSSNATLKNKLSEMEALKEKYRLLYIECTKGKSQ